MNNVEQQTEEWFQERAGFITASRASDMMAKGKGITREKYRTDLAIERYTEMPIRSGFSNIHTERGNALEAEARELYSLFYGVEIEQTGFIKHPILEWVGASPDGIIIDEKGNIEIKSPVPHVHIGYAINKKIPNDYMLQMQLGMAVTIKDYCDFISYCPELPPRLRLFVMRVPKDDKVIKTLEDATIEFNQEINALCAELKKL